MCWLGSNLVLVLLLTSLTCAAPQGGLRYAGHLDVDDHGDLTRLLPVILPDQDLSVLDHTSQAIHFLDPLATQGSSVKSNVSARYASNSCVPGHIRRHDGTCYRPNVRNKKVFLFNVPKQSRKLNTQALKIKDPKVDLNLVFLRLPKQLVHNRKPIVVPPPHQKTEIYVLQKNIASLSQEVVQIPYRPSKPDVYFVNYDSGENPELPGGISLQSTGGDDVGIDIRSGISEAETTGNAENKEVFEINSAVETVAIEAERENRAAAADKEGLAIEVSGSSIIRTVVEPKAEVLVQVEMESRIASSLGKSLDFVTTGVVTKKADEVFLSAGNIEKQLDGSAITGSTDGVEIISLAPITIADQDVVSVVDVAVENTAAVYEAAAVAEELETRIINVGSSDNVVSDTVGEGATEVDVGAAEGGDGAGEDATVIEGDNGGGVGDDIGAAGIEAGDIGGDEGSIGGDNGGIGGDDGNIGGDDGGIGGDDGGIGGDDGGISGDDGSINGDDGGIGGDDGGIGGDDSGISGDDGGIGGDDGGIGGDDGGISGDDGGIASDDSRIGGDDGGLISNFVNVRGNDDDRSSSLHGATITVGVPVSLNVGYEGSPSMGYDAPPARGYSGDPYFTNHRNLFSRVYGSHHLPSYTNHSPKNSGSHHSPSYTNHSPKNSHSIRYSFDVPNSRGHSRPSYSTGYGIPELNHHDSSYSNNYKISSFNEFRQPHQYGHGDLLYNHGSSGFRGYKTPSIPSYTAPHFSDYGFSKLGGYTDDYKGQVNFAYESPSYKNVGKSFGNTGGLSIELGQKTSIKDFLRNFGDDGSGFQSYENNFKNPFMSYFSGINNERNKYLPLFEKTSGGDDDVIVRGNEGGVGNNGFGVRGNDGSGVGDNDFGVGGNDGSSVGDNGFGEGGNDGGGVGINDGSGVGDDGGGVVDDGGGVGGNDGGVQVDEGGAEGDDGGAVENDGAAERDDGGVGGDDGGAGRDDGGVGGDDGGAGGDDGGTGGDDSGAGNNGAAGGDEGGAGDDGANNNLADFIRADSIILNGETSNRAIINTGVGTKLEGLKIEPGFIPIRFVGSNYKTAFRSNNIVRSNKGLSTAFRVFPNIRVEISGGSSTSVDTSDESSTSVETSGESSMSVETSGESSTSVETSGESSTSVETSGESSTSVETSGESSMSVETFGGSSASAENGISISSGLSEGDISSFLRNIAGTRVRQNNILPAVPVRIGRTRVSQSNFGRTLGNSNRLQSNFGRLGGEISTAFRPPAKYIGSPNLVRHIPQSSHFFTGFVGRPLINSSFRTKTFKRRSSNNENPTSSPDALSITPGIQRILSQGHKS